MYYHVKGDYKPIRFCAIRKTEEAEKKGVERLKAKKRVKGCGKPPDEARLASNRYVIVMTSLLETGLELIPRLYRFRWRIELVFKRLKPLFGITGYHQKLRRRRRLRFTGSYYWRRFVKQGRTKPVFPPRDGFIRGEGKRKYPVEFVEGTAGNAVPREALINA